ncbi:MAG: hypothetical protein ABI310_08250, partial [Microbacteriaceae bacterium]
INVVQTGSAGTSAATPQQITLSVVPKTPVIRTPSPGTTLSSGNQLTVSGTGTAGDALHITLSPTDGGAGDVVVAPDTQVPPRGSWTLTLDISALPNGRYTLNATQSNDAGASVAATSALTIAIPPGAPQITSPVNGTTISSGEKLAAVGTGIPGDTVNGTLTGPSDNSLSASAVVGDKGSWNLPFDIGSLPNGAYTLSVTQTNDAGSSAAVTRTLTIAIPPAAPAIISVETGGGLYFPVVSGTGVPGASVVVSGGADTSSDPIIVNAKGVWSTPQLDWTASSITATQTVGGVTSAASAAQPVTVSGAPTPRVAYTGWAYSDSGWGDGFTLTVIGASGGRFSAFGDGGEFYNGALDRSGSYSGGWVWVGADGEAHTISVRYDNGAQGSTHRYGPSGSTPFQVSNHHDVIAATTPSAAAPAKTTPSWVGVAPVAP